MLITILKLTAAILFVWAGRALASAIWKPNQQPQPGRVLLCWTARALGYCLALLDLLVWILGAAVPLYLVAASITVAVCWVEAWRTILPSGYGNPNPQVKTKAAGN